VPDHERLLLAVPLAAAAYPVNLAGSSRREGSAGNLPACYVPMVADQPAPPCEPAGRCLHGGPRFGCQHGDEFGGRAGPDRDCADRDWADRDWTA
jgi:hypothetical protein